MSQRGYLKTVNVFYHNEDIIKEIDTTVSCSEEWSISQMSSWKNLRQCAFHILYKEKDKERNEIEPFFLMDKNYLGIKVDIGLLSLSGNCLLVMPCQEIGSPPIVPMIYEIDKWCLEIILIVKNQEFEIKNGKSLAIGMVIPSVKNSLQQKDLSKFRNNLKEKRKSTRKYKFNNNEIDNYYEIVKNKNNSILYNNDKIFRRNYEKNS